MDKRRVKLWFPPELVKQPVLYQMTKNFEIVTNIHRANLTNDRGWLVIELSGETEEITRAIEWARHQGLRVDPADEETD